MRQHLVRAIYPRGPFCFDPPRKFSFLCGESNSCNKFTWFARFACSLFSRIKICVCGKSAEICGFVCAYLRRDTRSKINVVMDHLMCLTWYSVGVKGLGDAILHRNRETFVMESGWSFICASCGGGLTDNGLSYLRVVVL